MFRQRFMAFALVHLTGKYRALLEQRKKALLGGIGGRVLEIGPGTGPNLVFYKSGTQWIGLEPNPYLQKHIKDQSQGLDIDVEVCTGTAERIPIESASVDYVVSTLVLCSVRNPEAALGEILRVLKPGGRFVFLEHVAAPAGTGLRRVQRIFRPVSRFLADCTPDRETWAFIERAGFAEVNYERFRVPIPIDSPHIGGFARKSG